MPGVKKVVYTLAILLTFGMISCDPSMLNGVIATTDIPLTNEEVIQGLREALNNGTRSAVSKTSVTDGFWKNPLIRIPFPEEAAKVREYALSIGLSSQVESFELNLNRAAEKASGEATQVFLDAIAGMTISDGFAILHGDSVAATTYLRNNTESSLREKFEPIVADKIDEVQLTSLWQPLATAYNMSTILGTGQPVNPDLKAYVVQKALDGLFVYVAAEEKRIRRDPAARVTAILQRVFGNVSLK